MSLDVHKRCLRVPFRCARAPQVIESLCKQELRSVILGGLVGKPGQKALGP